MNGGAPRVQGEKLWLRDADGWRTEWLVGGLSPQTNYTAYALQDGTKVSGPIFLSTKSGTYLGLHNPFASR